MENKAVSLVFVDVEGGDWEGIYVDGNLYTDGHSLSPNVFLSLIGRYKNFSTPGHLTLSDRQMEELGFSLPAKYEHINKILGLGC